MTRLGGIWRYAALPLVLLFTAAIALAQSPQEKTQREIAKETSPATAKMASTSELALNEKDRQDNSQSEEEALELMLMQDPAFVKLVSDLDESKEAVSTLRAVSNGQNTATLEKYEGKVRRLQPEFDARVEAARLKMRQENRKATGTAAEQAMQLKFTEDSLIQIYQQQLENAEAMLIKNLKMIQSYTGGDPNKFVGDSQMEGIWKSQERIESLRSRMAKRQAELFVRGKDDGIPQGDNFSQEPSDPKRPQLYVIEPPDILSIEPIQLAPRNTVRIVPNDKVRIEASGTYADRPIHGDFTVDSAGEVVLGPRYGTVRIKGLTRREAQAAIETHLEEILVHPEVALTIDESRLRAGIGGGHLVCPDGTVNLGVYGSAYVSGMTVAQARAAIQTQLESSFVSPKIAIEVKAFNSKVYYIISEGGGAGDNIQRFPITGKETILDAIANIGGLSRIASKQIWIARPTNGADKILPVKWDDVVHGKDNSTNYRILPGDRIFIAADKEAAQRELEESKKNPPGQKFPEGQETF